MHDTIVLWLSNGNNDERVIREIIKGDNNLSGSRESKNSRPDWLDFTLCRSVCPIRYTHYHGIKKVYHYQSQIEAQPKIQIHSKQIGMPIYGYNGFLLGVIDCCMNVSIIFEYEITSWRASTPSIDHTTNEPVYDSRTYIDYSSEQNRTECETKSFRLLIEIKPKLNSISATLGQVKAYRNTFDSKYSLKTVLLTLDDQATKFDTLLRDEGIEVYRIPKTEIEELI